MQKKTPSVCQVSLKVYSRILWWYSKSILASISPLLHSTRRLHFLESPGQTTYPIAYWASDRNWCLNSCRAVANQIDRRCSRMEMDLVWCRFSNPIKELNYLAFNTYRRIWHFQGMYFVGPQVRSISRHLRLCSGFAWLLWRNPYTSFRFHR